MKKRKVLIGQHCWALMGEKLVVVLKITDDGYDVCGAWECGIGEEDLTILEIIKKPANNKDCELYYLPNPLPNSNRKTR